MISPETQASWQATQLWSGYGEEPGKSIILKWMMDVDGVGRMDKIPQRRCGEGSGTKPYLNYELEWNFWSKLRISKSGCWEYPVKSKGSPYGIMRNGTGHTEKPHRFSWRLTQGDIADGLFVLHKCDNPCCVRPSHLSLGSHFDNMRDMASKGRTGVHRGENNYLAKIDDKIALEIKEMWATGNFYKMDIARKFNVSHSLVWNVINGNTWKHVQ